MQKTGEVTKGKTPCEYCGRESVGQKAGVMVCAAHLDSATDPPINPGDNGNVKKAEAKITRGERCGRTTAEV